MRGGGEDRALAVPKGVAKGLRTPDEFDTARWAAERVDNGAIMVPLEEVEVASLAALSSSSSSSSSSEAG